MKNVIRRMKMATVVVATSVLFQFGGCVDFGGFLHNARIGFSRSIGANIGSDFYDSTVRPLLDSFAN